MMNNPYLPTILGRLNLNNGPTAFAGAAQIPNVLNRTQRTTTNKKVVISKNTGAAQDMKIRKSVKHVNSILKLIEQRKEGKSTEQQKFKQKQLEKKIEKFERAREFLTDRYPT